MDTVTERSEYAEVGIPHYRLVDPASQRRFGWS
jgi:hypothetical protein